MFGLTKREQRWKAEQQASELLVHFAVATVRSLAEANSDAAELKRLRAENETLRLTQAKIGDAP